MLLSYSHSFCKNLGSWHKVCSNARIHTGFCVGGEVWEVVVEADMCRRVVVRMVDLMDVTLEAQTSVLDCEVITCSINTYCCYYKCFQAHKIVKYMFYQ